VTNKLDIAKVLFAHVADVNARDEFQQTPLHKAASNNNHDISKLRCARQRRACLPRDVSTASSCACSSSSPTSRPPGRRLLCGPWLSLYYVHLQ
jgi:ankyrin repeat protein